MPGDSYQSLETDYQSVSTARKNGIFIMPTNDTGSGNSNTTPKRYPVSASNRTRAQSYSGRKTSHVSMPVGWRCYSIWNGIEIWDYPDGSEVHISPEFHEAIWIRVRQEIKTAWPLLDSPMPYPSSDIPVTCETPDCTICALMNIARQIVIAVSRGNS